MRSKKVRSRKEWAREELATILSDAPTEGSAVKYAARFGSTPDAVRLLYKSAMVSTSSKWVKLNPNPKHIVGRVRAMAREFGLGIAQRIAAPQEGYVTRCAACGEAGAGFVLVSAAVGTMRVLAQTTLPAVEAAGGRGRLGEGAGQLPDRHAQAAAQLRPASPRLEGCRPSHHTEAGASQFCLAAE